VRLECVSRFSNHEHDFKAGQEINVSDEEGALLMRCSPGSFRLPEPPKPEPVSEPEAEEPTEAEIAAMSTETETGIVAPDRRARGGKKRTKRIKS
jgi:hypothetical protein